MPLAFRRAGLGSAAPALDLPAADGRRRSLAEFRGRPVMVSFLGPANCAFCRAHVIRTIQARDQFEAAGAEVVFVAYHDPELLTAKMMRDLDLPYLLLLDSTREAYVRWGLGRAGLRNALWPGLYWAGLKLQFSRPPDLGSVPPGPAQLGGDFVVDRGGRLALVNRLKSFHDRAPIGRLLEALRSA